MIFDGARTTCFPISVLNSARQSRREWVAENILCALLLCSTSLGVERAP